MTLESLISLTDELAHLNELVMLHVEKSGGFTCTEGEIRLRYRAGMSRNQMKLIIQDWIDKEIAGMNSCEPAFVPEPDPEKLP